MVRSDEELVVVVNGRQYAFVGLPIRSGSREDDRGPPDVLGLESGECCHAAGVCGGENAETQDDDSSMAHGSSLRFETCYRGKSL
jgi:hypothetical protein